VNDFVEQCRMEWSRLKVPQALAEEMAADLTADLEEAEADGVPVEELLGSGASDPRSFAASWAAERGIIPEPSGPTDRGRPRFLVAFTAVAAIAVVVSAVLLATGEPKVALVTARAKPPGLASPPTALAPGRVTASAAAPIEWILLVVALVALGFAAWLWSNRVRAQPPGGSALA
jgi:hypothetical protein